MKRTSFQNQEQLVYLFLLTNNINLINEFVYFTAFFERIKSTIPNLIFKSCDIGSFT